LNTIRVKFEADENYRERLMRDKLSVNPKLLACQNWSGLGIATMVTGIASCGDRPLLWSVVVHCNSSSLSFFFFPNITLMFLDNSPIMLIIELL